LRNKKGDFFGISGNGNETMFSDETDADQNFCFRLMRNFRFTVVLHGQSSRSNTWPWPTEPPKHPMLYFPLH
jgi:hypothetical protein